MRDVRSWLTRLMLSGLAAAAPACHKTEQRSAVVPPTGGTLSSADGTLTVDVPAGALSSPLTITVSAAGDVPAGAVGPAFDIGPTGTTFAQPVALTFRYDPQSLTDPNDDLEVATVVGGQWVSLPASAVDTTNHVVIGLTDHLSPYALTHGTKDKNPAAPCLCNATAFANCCQQSPGMTTSASPNWCWCTVPSLQSFGSLYDCYAQQSHDHLASGCTGGFHDCCAQKGGFLWPYRSDICVCTVAGNGTPLIDCWRGKVAAGEALGHGNAQVTCSPQDMGQSNGAPGPGPCCAPDNSCAGGGCCVLGACVAANQTCGQEAQNATCLASGSCGNRCGGLGQPCCGNYNCTAPKTQCNVMRFCSPDGGPNLGGCCESCGGSGQLCCGSYCQNGSCSGGRCP